MSESCPNCEANAKRAEQAEREENRLLEIVNTLVAEMNKLNDAKLQAERDRDELAAVVDKLSNRWLDRTYVIPDDGRYEKYLAGFLRESGLSCETFDRLVKPKGE